MRWGAALVTALALLAPARADEPTTRTMGMLIIEQALRQPIDLETLAERARPDHPGSDNTALFEILRLREEPDPAATDALGEILAKHFDQTHVFGFAAAQALFAIGGEPAHALLERYLLDARYHAPSGLRYIEHWEMKSPERDRFIGRYHLRHLAEDLEVELAVEPLRDEEVLFRVCLRNLSDRTLSMPFELYDDGLNFRDQHGHWILPRIYRLFRLEKTSGRSLELKPGASHDYPIHLRLEREDGEARLVGWGHDWKIGQAERLEAVYMLANSYPGPADQTPPRWLGRAVSRPVELKIPPEVAAPN